jgi:hemoglobin
VTSEVASAYHAGVAETLYEHAGGDEGLHRLEELFYAKALADPVLGALFTERVPTHVDHLTWFTAESFGGPDRFTQELPADAPFRQAVREHVEFGSQVAQQNSWAESDSELHPIREVPAGHWPADR